MFDLQSLHGTLWLAEPTQLRLTVLRIARMRDCPTARQLVKARQKRLELARQAAARAAVRSAGGKVGVIAVHGPIDQRTSAVTEKAGGTSTEEVSLALDTLCADPSVKAIVLHVDSPGGSSYGVEELADKIYGCRAQKPIYAIADSMACSAAYWIASAASPVCCTPGGDVGSVGVYAVHVDQSAALEQAGIKTSLVSAGKFKTEGNPFEPLDAEARAWIQRQVDATYSRFCQGLKKCRGTTLDDVRKNYGQGRVLNADAALAARMIDQIWTFEGLMGKLTGGAGSAGVRQASAEVLRARHELAKLRTAWKGV